MNPIIEAEIKKCKTVKEYLDVLLKYYDCENCTPSSFILSSIVNKLVSMVSGQNIILTEALRIRAINSKNVKEFIELVKSNFSLNKNFTASPDTVVSNTKALVALTNLKEKPIPNEAKIVVTNDSMAKKVTNLLKRKKNG